MIATEAYWSFQQDEHRIRIYWSTAQQKVFVYYDDKEIKALTHFDICWTQTQVMEYIKQWITQ